MQYELKSFVWLACLSCLALTACDNARKAALDETVTSSEQGPAAASAQQLTAATTVTLNAIGDAHVAQAFPTYNYGTSSVLELTGAALSSWQGALVKFDAAALQTALASGTLEFARLELTVASTSLGLGNSQVNVHRMLVPWTETGATWLCANDTSTTGLGQFLNNCSVANRWGIEWWSLLPRPYQSSVTSVVSVPFGQQGLVTIDVTQDINTLAGSAHQGYFLTPAAGLSSVWIRLASRQSSTPPRLVLSISPTCVASGPDTTCNGVDENCNGVNDEGYTSVATACGIGACARSGLARCINGIVSDSCQPGVPAADDSSCDGVDNNCNGQADESYAARETSCGVGACARTGMTVCTAGMENSTCTPAQPQSADDDSCDGVDDNCNGQSDEGYASAVTRCGVGACGNTGMSSCVNSVIHANCTANPPIGLSDVTCDGVDDDCNGLIDEAFAGMETSCGTGACARTGTSMCIAGDELPGCVPGQPAASDASCDGVDDDCSGATDEDYLATQTECEAGGCRRHGHTRCSSGQVSDSCTTSGVCYAESNCTDDQDNDLDGKSDCSDQDCLASGSCALEICGNDLDDDDDGDFDCADEDCFDVSICKEIPPSPASVAPSPDLTIATSFSSSLSFMYTGAAPFQKGVAPGVHVASRVALLSGRVADSSGQPLPAVRVAVHDHPELGWTNTRLDGQFDLVVNGGGLLVLTASLPGYLTVHRQVETDWNAPTSVPELRMMQVDPISSSVDLSGTVGLQTARGSTSVDADGPRAGTLLFPSGVEATLVDVDGQTVPGNTMPEIAVRVTEYTVGPNGAAQMPAELPPNTAYTYAMELSADGYESVEFSKPLPYYLENFLGFPVGTSLPLGFYDSRQARWIAQDSGYVVKVVGSSGPLADLDVDGDDVADDALTLAQLGVTAEERAEVLRLYSVGATLWRVQVTHFSTYDINMGMVPDSRATFPDASAGAPPVPSGSKPPCNEDGSQIDCQEQTLGEDVEVSGTPYSLHYNSDLVPGRSQSLKVKLGSRSRLDAPELELVTAEFQPKYGMKAQFAFCKGQVPNNVEWEWPGADSFGRPVSGNVPVYITVRYYYKSYFGTTSRFGQNPDGRIAVDQDYRRSSGAQRVEQLCRQQTQRTLYNSGAAGIAAGYVSFRQDFTSFVMAGFDPRQAGVGGFTLSPHHFYDPEGKLLVLGNGQQVRAHEMPRAAVKKFSLPHINDDQQGLQKMARSPDDTIYTLARLNTTLGRGALGVGRIAPSGAFDYVAKVHYPVGSNCTRASSSTYPTWTFHNLPASEANFCRIQSIALSPDGELYIADFAARLIVKVDTAGISHIVAGDGRFNPSPDGGVAALSSIGPVMDVEVGADGKVYFVSGNRLRFVDTDGRLGTLAGVPPGESPNLGLAPNAAKRYNFSRLERIEVLADGTVYFTEPFSKLGRVNVDGTISIVAGISGPNDVERARAGYLQLMKTDNSITLFSIGRQVEQPLVSRSSTCTVGTLPARCPARPDGSIAAAAGFNKLTGTVPGAGEHIYVRDSFDIYDVSAPTGVLTSNILVPSPDGAELYVFDYSGRHLQTRDMLTNAVRNTFSYDAAGRLVSIAGVGGNVVQIIRNPVGLPTAIIAPFGQRTELATNGAGYLSQVRPDPERPPYVFTYVSDQGLLQSKTDPSGYTHVFAYSGGRLVADDAPDGRSVQLDRVEDGDIATVTFNETDGGVKTFVSDASQPGKFVSTVVFPDGAMNQSMQNADGTVSTQFADGTVLQSSGAADPVLGSFAPVVSSVVTTPAGRRRTHAETVTVSPAGSAHNWTQRVAQSTVNGRTTITTFDRSSRRETTVTAAGRIYTRTLDDLGRTVEILNPGRGAMLFELDSRGRLEAIRQGERQTDYGYDPQTGFLASVTTPDVSEATLFARDSTGRPTEILNAAGDAIAITYDSVGNLASFAPPSRSAHAFNYTPASLASKYVAPRPFPNTPTSDTEIEYSKHRHPRRIVRPNGAIVLTYGPHGKVTTIASARGIATVAYDAVGRVDSLGDVDGGSLAFGYDGGLLTSTRWLGTGRPSGQVTYTYDNNMWLDVVTVNSTDSTDYSYDGDGLVTGAGQLTLSRSAVSGDITATALDNVATSQATNEYGEVDDFAAMHAGATFYREQTVARDGHGRVLESLEYVENVATSYRYTYDDIGRLTEVRTNGEVSAHYEYDPNGNRVRFTKGANATLEAVYDGQDRLSSYGNVNFTYNGAGDLAAKVDGLATTTYDYDVFGALRSVMRPDGTSIAYDVDASNRRIGKRRGGIREYGLLYRSQLAPIAMLDASNSVVATYVYATRENVPDYMTKAGQRYRFVCDRRGSVRLVVRSSDGFIAQRLDYDAFGQVLSDSSPGFQPFAFAGGLYDADTGFVRFGARDYDPETGRWTAKDPVLLRGGTANLYEYASGDPVNNVDVSGLYVSGRGISEWIRDGQSARHEIVNAIAPQPCDQRSPLQRAWDGLWAGLEYLDHMTLGLGPAGMAKGPAAEKMAKDIAKRVEKDLGKDARRTFHDMKQKFDRTAEELREDARQLYEEYGREIPKWLR